MNEQGSKDLSPRLRLLFLKELKLQSEWALDEIDGLLAGAPAELVWRKAQALLVSLSICSRILWPPQDSPKQVSDNSYKLRGEALRRELDITDASPLVSRELRDSIEHIDERFHSWGSDSTIQQPVDQAVVQGATVEIRLGDPSVKNIFRFYDNGILRFWDLALDLSKVRDELAKLHGNAERLLEEDASGKAH